MSERAKKDNASNRNSDSDIPGDSPSHVSRKRARREDNAPVEESGEERSTDNQEVPDRERIPLDSRESIEQWMANNPRWRESISQVRDERERGEMTRRLRQILEQEEQSSPSRRNSNLWALSDIFFSDRHGLPRQMVRPVARNDIANNGNIDGHEIADSDDSSVASYSSPFDSTSSSSSSDFADSDDDEQPRRIHIHSNYLRYQQERILETVRKESSDEALRDTNMVAVAVMEEVWNYYRCSATPVLLLKQKYLNPAALKFLLYQISCLEKDNLPQTLSLDNCSFSNVLLSSTLDLLSTFVERNADRWKHLRMSGMCMRNTSQTQDQTLGSQSFYAQRGNFVATLLPINSIEPMEPSLTKLPMLCKALDSLELCCMDLTSSNTGKLLRGWLGSTNCACPVSILKLKHCYIHLNNVWKPLMEGLHVHARQGLHSLVINDCDTGMGQLCGESLECLVNVGLKGAMDDPKSRLTSLDLSRVAPEGLADESGFSSSFIGHATLPVFTHLLEGLHSLESIKFSNHRDLFAFKSREENDEKKRGNVTSLMKFLSVITHHPKLKVVNLSSCGMKPFIAQNLLKRLSNNKTSVLESLDLRFNKFYESVAQEYLPRLPPSLHRLYLVHPGFTLTMRGNSRDRFRDALSRNIYLLECQSSDEDTPGYRSIFRRNRMVRIAKSILRIQPTWLWPKLFEIIPQDDDATALFVALKEGCPILAEQDLSIRSGSH